MSTDPNASQNTARISPNQARARSEEYFNTIVDKGLMIWFHWDLIVIFTIS